MTGGRVVVLGDPGPWLCSGMTGGVVYVRQNDDWGLDEAAVRRRLSKAAKVSLTALDESDDATVAELLGAYREALVGVRPGRGGRAPPAAHRRAVGALPGDHPGDPAGRPQHLDGVAADGGRSPGR